MSLDLASFHLRLWRLNITLAVEVEQPLQAEQAEPMGFAPFTIESPEVEEDGEDLEDRRLGF